MQENCRTRARSPGGDEPRHRLGVADHRAQPHGARRPALHRLGARHAGGGQADVGAQQVTPVAMAAAASGDTTGPSGTSSNANFTSLA